MNIKNFVFLILIFVGVLGSQSVDQTLPNPITPDNETFESQNPQNAFGEYERNKSQVSSSDSGKYINGRKKHVRTLDYPVKIGSFNQVLENVNISFNYNYFVSVDINKASTIPQIRTEQKYFLLDPHYTDDPTSDDLQKLIEKVQQAQFDGVVFGQTDLNQNPFNFNKMISAIQKFRKALPNHLIFLKYNSEKLVRLKQSSSQLLEIIDDVDLYIAGKCNYQMKEQPPTYSEDIFGSDMPFDFKDLVLNLKIPGRKIAIAELLITDPFCLIEKQTLNQWMVKAYQDYGPFAGLMTWGSLSQLVDTNYIDVAMEGFDKKFQPTSDSYDCSLTPCRDKIERPIIFGYISGMSWWESQKLLESLMVPGYTKTQGNPYNAIAFTFWEASDKIIDAAKFWASISYYLGSGSPFGQTDQEIRQNMKKVYNDNGIRILVSAFGREGRPTSTGQDPNTTAESLAMYVKDYHLDGVDVDWEDKDTLKNPVEIHGKKYYGDDWLNEFTIKLRELLPNHIITHAPEAVLFNTENEDWKHHSYLMIDIHVGSLIDFYNIQYYNMDDYETNQTLLYQSKPYYSKRTSVSELLDKKIDGDKIVIGKPLSFQDAYEGHGYISDFTTYGEWIGDFYEKRQKEKDISERWNGGVMYWQVHTNLAGDRVRNATKCLISKYRQEHVK